MNASILFININMRVFNRTRRKQIRFSVKKALSMLDFYHYLIILQYYPRVIFANSNMLCKYALIFASVIFFYNLFITGKYSTWHILVFEFTYFQTFVLGFIGYVRLHFRD